MTKHDRLISALKEIKSICSKNEDYDLGCGRKCPFADVAERRKGQWIKVGESIGALDIVYDELQCSECGWTYSLLPTKFCSNCGAKMEAR